MSFLTIYQELCVLGMEVRALTQGSDTCPRVWCKDRYINCQLWLSERQVVKWRIVWMLRE